VGLAPVLDQGLIDEDVDELCPVGVADGEELVVDVAVGADPVRVAM
jgi:hypothetical protein